MPYCHPHDTRHTCIPRPWQAVCTCMDCRILRFIYYSTCYLTCNWPLHSKLETCTHTSRLHCRYGNILMHFTSITIPSLLCNKLSHEEWMKTFNFLLLNKWKHSVQQKHWQEAEPNRDLWRQLTVQVTALDKMQGYIMTSVLSSPWRRPEYLAETSARQTCSLHAGVREPHLSHDCASGEAVTSKTLTFVGIYAK